MNLDLKIENLISENRDDFEVSKCIKDEINSYINSLDTLFEKDQGKSFLINHTRSIDRFIKVIFKYTLRKQFGDFLPLINTLPITIVSLGSYAREQLCVYSDIDLMIVYKDTDGYNLKPIIETILQIAWDSGLKLGHRVHEIKDLYPASRQDHTIKTALLESRYICGSKYLWMSVEQELIYIRKDDQKAFILSKIDERQKRTLKYPFNMQPDIKNSKGGLRDLNTLFWISNILHNITRIKDLSQDIIEYEVYSQLMNSVEFLFRVRIALHLSAGKKIDKLLLQYIPDIATKLKMSQRKLVEKTFESMLKVETICEYMVKKVTHEILFDKNNLSKIRKYRKSKNIYLDTNGICSPLHTDSEKLEYFIDVFLELPDASYCYKPTFIHYLQIAKKHKIDYTKIKALFYKKYLYTFMIALYKSKQLNNIFKPMKKVAHLPQFDGYHEYPVDIHSIRTLKALENINDIHVKNLFSSFDKEEKVLLKIIAFLHDCGKGRKKDHSLLGAVIVKNFIEKLKFDKKHIEYADLLVRHHTLMSNIASREDIYSEKVIFSFLAKLKHPKVLELLYVLTYADIASVGDNAYSNFNSKLLNELFLISKEAYVNKKMITEAQKRAKKEKNLKSSPEFKDASSILKKKILSIESNLLFFKYKPNEIVRIASWVNSLLNPYNFIITNDKMLTIEIIRSNEINLGYLFGKLKNLNVASMDIFKIFKNIKYFKIEFLESAEEEDLLFIEEIIYNSFDMSKKIALETPQVLKEEIEIDCNHSNSYAMMTLYTKDHPKLLANIMSTFDDIGIDIASAKIQTIKNRARNLFLIEKNGKFCANQDEVIKRLTIKG